MPPSDDQVQGSSYTVLYYKRKAKVHKAKGVSKKDGELTILPPPKGRITLKDGNLVVFQGTLSEIVKRANTLQEEDILNLGAYEVEIVDRLAGNSGRDHSSCNNITAPKPIPLRRSVNIAGRPLYPSSRPLLSKNVATTVSTRGTPCHANGRPIVRPPQPKAMLQDDSSSEEKSGPMFAKENKQRTGIKRGFSDKRKPLGTMSKVRRHATTTAIGTTSTTTSAASSIPTAPKMSNEFFPNAVGTLNVPHSIKSIGKAACASPHVSDTQIFRGAILADEMGLGKTLMTIAAICALHRQKRDRRFVVVCPSSLVTNWANEFDKWLGKASQPKRVVVKKGGKEGLSKIKAWSTKVSEVLIISYDLFRMNADFFSHVEQPVACLVVDEGHRLKNTAGSLTLTALESLQCQARLCITATPMQNNLSDFFTVANFVCPGLLGDLASFRREYDRPISASNNKKCSTKQRQCGINASRRLDAITKTFMLRRLQKDILKTMLPPRLELLMFCRPSRTQCNLYQRLTENHRVQDGKATADALTTLTKLRKLCSHPILLNNGKASDEDIADVAASGKIYVLESLLREIRAMAPDDKVVIVSNYTSALSMIEKSIIQPCGFTHIRLDGTTDLKNRQNLVDTFNTTSADRHFAFLLSSKAGGCGLNLIGANRLVMFDPDWNPASDIQAMARVYRQGQKKPCSIYRMFTTGTVEEVICQRQIQKGNLATRAVDGSVPKSGGNTTSFSKEELRECFVLKTNCDCDTKNKVGTRWADYSGAESVKEEGCSDEPLLAICSESSSPLSFVHVVREADVEKVHETEVLFSDSEDDDACFSSEEEFEF
eukprot:scaffold481_cov208-Cylindrotheca_fusiformis.AAC.9